MYEGEKTVKNSLVSLELDGDVAVIIIDNPPVNAVNSEVMAQLNQILHHVEELEKVRAAVITGAGEKAFVAGADIKQFTDLDESSGKALALFGQSVFEKISRLNIPVICAVNGFALGAGCELALACDIRFAAMNAKFGLPEVGLGIIPGYGGTQRLARLIGSGKAKELILSGEQISAEEAYRIGLVERIVPAGEALNSSIVFARKIARNAPLALERAKRAIDTGLNMSLQEGIQFEADLFGQLCETKDKNEGAAAFLEKRSPKFEGQ
ncbi:enoyl-CoA hydratase/isomerase family protein [Bacillus sp. EB600]|uniref:enoyl-CoA hydratase/isomerase family protein n=1 Tax=Bacillus sp. EB600 TaxID=2806345 RepID=UPI00210B9B7E|nr:enoyl-CoA hydratase-related protein [Bacillus sp. EB600]MCQ6281679.1 enoyl-CoA hydratase/isomerase family protein [Bacillus sp. EB600]